MLASFHRRHALYLGSTLLLAACSSPGNTIDAAPPVCDCPAAEPPLTGRITTETFSAQNITAGTRDSTTGTCANLNAQLLSAGCYVEGQELTPSGDVYLMASYRVVGTNSQWRCLFDNRSTSDAHIMFTLTCLNPPQ